MKEEKKGGRQGKPASEYWQERAIEREALWNKKCRATIEAELAEQYTKALTAIQEDITALYGMFAKDNKLELHEAIALLKGEEYKQWRMSLEAYAKLSETDNAILRELNTLTMRSRVSRLEKLHSETLQELYKLGVATEERMNRFLEGAFKDNYYRSLFEIGRTAGLYSTISAVDDKLLEKVLKNPWSGKAYSARIWTNQEKLAQTLKDTVFAGIHRGVSVPKLSRLVKERMDVGRYEATRLVRTELNYVHNQANLESIKDSGMMFYKFVATLDSRTSQKCRAHDGSIVPVEEASPGDNLPPLHPHCRSTIIGSLGEGIGGQKGTRIARDSEGHSFHIPRQMTYSDYKAVYIDKSKTFDAWAEETGFQSIKAKPALAVEAKAERPSIQFTNMDREIWDRPKALLGELSSEYKTKLKTVEYKADKGSIQKGPGEVDITSSAMRLSSSLDSVVVHEFAHTLAVEKADKLGLTDNHLFWNEIRKVRTAYRKARAKNPNISISAYADNPGKNPLDEFMAEAFAHAKCAEKGIKISGYGTDHTYSKKVLETIDKYFKQTKVKRSGVDVMQEYAAKAKPGQGKVSQQDGFRANAHLREISAVNTLYAKYGGDFELLDEMLSPATKTPDFIWNGNAWDLKSIETYTKNAIDKAVRGGLHQVKNGNGGLVLDFLTADFDVSQVTDIVDYRLSRSIKNNADIIIMHYGQVKTIRRYVMQQKKNR
ncbi:MAG: minor capsid protein [Selenomonas sp.]|nr:minor capsid protein [Selenomonas sp.]